MALDDGADDHNVSANLWGKKKKSKSRCNLLLALEPADTQDDHCSLVCSLLNICPGAQPHTHSHSHTDSLELCAHAH